jgi:uncharacterized protein YkwD
LHGGARLDTRATIAQRAGLAVALALAAAPSPAAERHPDIARATAMVIDETNAFRRHEGRGAVERNPKLEEAAREFARYLARTETLEHDADGHTPGERAQRHGYRWCRIAENIAYQFDSRGYATEALAQGLVEGWKKSPGHRRNMLERDVKHIAVAVARSDRNGYYYAVQMFGKPC